MRVAVNVATDVVVWAYGRRCRLAQTLTPCTVPFAGATELSEQLGRACAWSRQGERRRVISEQGNGSGSGTASSDCWMALGVEMEVRKLKRLWP